MKYNISDINFILTVSWPFGFHVVKSFFLGSGAGDFDVDDGELCKIVYSMMKMNFNFSHKYGAKCIYSTILHIKI